MIKSMTGFGRSEIVTKSGKVSVEMKSVNHRYLDLNIKMPKKFNAVEGVIRSYIKEHIQRGKLDVYINYESFAEENLTIQYNQSVAKEYMDHFKAIGQDFDLPMDVTVSKLAGMPDVLTAVKEDENEEELWDILKPAFDEATDKFIKVREAEGKQLQTDLLAKLDNMRIYADKVEEHYPSIISDYRERLTAKMKEFLANTDVDDARIASEVVIYADKCCVDEETVRLKSHISQMKDALLSSESVGRKLDFLAQEMNREANTMLSKSTDLTLTDTAISLKTEIEKIREQVQNIE